MIPTLSRDKNTIEGAITFPRSAIPTVSARPRPRARAARQAGGAGHQPRALRSSLDADALHQPVPSRVRRQGLWYDSALSYNTIHI